MLSLKTIWQRDQLCCNQRHYPMVVKEEGLATYVLEECTEE